MKKMVLLIALACGALLFSAGAKNDPVSYGAPTQGKQSVSECDQKIAALTQAFSARLAKQEKKVEEERSRGIAIGVSSTLGIIISLGTVVLVGVQRRPRSAKTPKRVSVSA